MTQSKLRPSPRRSPVTLSEHGVTRVDEYYWMRDRNDPELLPYLEAEQQHYLGQREKFLPLASVLYEEHLAHIDENEQSVAWQHGPYFYYSRAEQGKSYRLHCRKRCGERSELPRAVEEILIDPNTMAGADSYLSIVGVQPSPDHRIIAFGVNTDGSDRYTVRFFDSVTQTLLEETIPETWSYGGFAWGCLGEIYFLRLDATQRPYQLWYRRLGSGLNETLIYEEQDVTLRLSLERSRSGRFLYLTSEGKDQNETRILPLAGRGATVQLLHPKERGVLSHFADHGDFIFQLTTKDAPYGKVLRRQLIGGDWECFIAEVEGRPLTGVEAFATRLLISGRQAGFTRLWEIAPSKGSLTPLPIVGESYFLATSHNPDFNPQEILLRYSSLVTPMQDLALRSSDGAITCLQEQTVRNYRAADYQTSVERFSGSDGVAVPASVVFRKDKRQDSPAPLLMIAYGAYGISTEPIFRAWFIGLLDRGVTVVLAHVRGGGEFGRPWYEAGKLARKQQTFSDFISIAEGLIQGGWTSPELLMAMGGSAGGLLMGAVCNQRPDLFAAIVAEVPFVDVLTTMADPSIPLTAQEWDEWGDPRIAEQYDWIRGYSPYDNVQAKIHYPHLLATAGLNDPRVPYWEPAKWVARLRERSENSKPILFRVHLGAGHGGSSGRYARWQEVAENYAFLLSKVGLG